MIVKIPLRVLIKLRAGNCVLVLKRTVPRLILEATYSVRAKMKHRLPILFCSKGTVAPRLYLVQGLMTVVAALELEL